MTPWEAQTGLLACAIDTLDDLADVPGLVGAPGRQSVYSGPDAPWDDCCGHGGQLWVRVNTAQPVDPLPVWDTTPTKCGKTMGVELGLGIVRCARTIDEHGNPPRPIDLTAEAYQVTEDMGALARAVLCCLPGRKILGRWTPYNLGGCVGGEWSVWVHADMSAPGSPGSP